MYKFLPITKTLIWGTERWVISAVPCCESVIVEGPDAGKSISDIWPGQFPLLLKFIDAAKDLSIQVHPDDALARERHGCNGKTEMWYVTGAEDGARLISGFKEKMDPEDYSDLVGNGRITEYLASHEIREGDVFYLPAGRVHAIGSGCHIAEIQQTSDITYRIYDYNRPGLDGKPRELHTDLAKDAIDYEVADDYRTHYEHRKGSEVLLVECPYFTTSLLETDTSYFRQLNTDFLAMVCLEGSGMVNGSPLSAGEAGLLIKEDLEVVPSGLMKILLVHS